MITHGTAFVEPVVRWDAISMCLRYSIHVWQLHICYMWALSRYDWNNVESDVKLKHMYTCTHIHTHTHTHTHTHKWGINLRRYCLNLPIMHISKSSSQNIEHVNLADICTNMWNTKTRQEIIFTFVCFFRIDLWLKEFPVFSLGGTGGCFNTFLSSVTRLLKLITFLYTSIHVWGHGED